MEEALLRRIATVRFWDRYARWYKLWIEHTRYHERIIEVMRTMVKSGWKVLDIGAGSGILSIPLCQKGCDVTALEPSMGMRNLLYEEVSKNGIGELNVDMRPWEDVSCNDYMNYDLIIACNTLHLTGLGFVVALLKIFCTNSRNVFLVIEPDSNDISVKEFYGGYKLLFKKSYEIDNSFAYHDFEEIIEHWSFMKGRVPSVYEIDDLKKRVIFREGHLWIKQRSSIMMCWWKKIRGCSKII